MKDKIWGNCHPYILIKLVVIWQCLFEDNSTSTIWGDHVIANRRKFFIELYLFISPVTSSFAVAARGSSWQISTSSVILLPFTISVLRYRRKIYTVTTSCVSAFNKVCRKTTVCNCIVVVYIVWVFHQSISKNNLTLSTNILGTNSSCGCIVSKPNISCPTVNKPLVYR